MVFIRKFADLCRLQSPDLVTKLTITSHHCGPVRLCAAEICLIMRRKI